MPYKPTGRPNGRPRKSPPTHGGKPVLTPAQLRGVEAEMRLEGADNLLFQESATAVATSAGVSVRTVNRWRLDPHYKQGVEQRWGWLIARDMREHNRPRRPEPLSEQKRAALISERVNNEWGGPVESPLDGRIYTTPEEYAEHVLASGCIFWDDMPH